MVGEVLEIVVQVVVVQVAVGAESRQDLEIEAKEGLECAVVWGLAASIAAGAVSPADASANCAAASAAARCRLWSAP